MCLYFELLFKCATTASLHFFACAEINVMKWLRANQWAQQCRVTFLPLQQFRQKINITTSRWLTESELSCERRTLSDQDILLETDNISNVEIKYRGFRICKVVHSEQRKQNCRLRKREWLIFLGFRAMSRKNTKISCNHFKVKSRFSFKIIR